MSFLIRLHGRTVPSEKTLSAHQLNRCYKAMFCLSICIVGFNCFFSKRVVLLKANWESVIWDYFKKKKFQIIIIFVIIIRFNVNLWIEIVLIKANCTSVETFIMFELIFFFNLYILCLFFKFINSDIIFP